MSRMECPLGPGTQARGKVVFRPAADSLHPGQALEPQAANALRTQDGRWANANRPRRKVTLRRERCNGCPPWKSS